MEVDPQSLFSLELVVEKLYIPHVQCRFPAVAFRLLDFPTILIEHVEKDLAQTIRRKIAKDPYFKIPHQFGDLKDKHGNFMIKKGKSCLFKIPTKTLRAHLSNTPLYVMIIDSFPNVPKLLGNCTVPLDEVMDHILTDIKTLGSTVPSVHGDKGLYKIYSLMGKEIGYLILGYRVLSLGPGLIPHIPDGALAKRASEVQEHEFIQPASTKKTSSAVSHTHTTQMHQDSLIETQEMGSMTDPEKHDVLLQTLETEDKNIHVEISEPVVKTITEDKAIEVKEMQAISTQTEKKKKKPVRKDAFDFRIENSDNEDDGFLFSDIAQPPPLFYNSKFEPVRKTQRVYAYDDDDSDASSVYTDEMTIENLSDEDVPTKEEKRAKRDKSPSAPQSQLQMPGKAYNYSTTQQLPTGATRQQNVQPNTNLQGALQNGALFPMLTALLNELSCLQNPQLVQQTVNQVQNAASGIQHQRQQIHPSNKQQPVTSTARTPRTPTKVAPVQKTRPSTAGGAPLNRREVMDRIDEEEKENISIQPGRRSHKTCAHAHDGVPSQKSWIRKVPEVSVKKSKLTYGLTNTHRLRLARVKSAEKAEMESKSQKQVIKTKKEEDDEQFETGNLDDTLTEVRRLAEKNLEATGNLDDTLQTVDTNFSLNSLKPHKKKVGKHTDKRVESPSEKKGSPARKRSKSPKGKKSKDKSVEKSQQSQVTPHQDAIDYDRGDNDDTPSSHSQKSIQVRIPSAQIYEDDSDDDYYKQVMESREKKTKSRTFAGFMDDDLSLVDSPDGQDEVDNHHFDDSYKEDDYDQPLESTRNSRPSALPHNRTDSAENKYYSDSFESDQSPRHNRANDESKIFQSEDYDTRQFQSTDEPELQRLISSGERSQISDQLSERSAKSPVPGLASARFQVLNPKASLNSPIPALRRSQVKLGSSNAAPSPTGTPRSRSQARRSPVTPRSPGSSKNPTPRPRKLGARERRADFKLDSIHTESVSSYMPSDSDENYSDDFNMGDDEKGPVIKRMNELPIISSAKLGYTIG